MGYGVLTAFLDKDSRAPDGVILTAVAPGGCPLDCPPCLIRLRGERSEDAVYSPEHLTILADALKKRGDLGGVAAVGDEPLQEKSWPYTEALLRAANDHDVPSAVVTNGYHLPEFAQRLRALDNGRTKIQVSLDAHGGAHDILRRTEGAFARADQGLRALLQGAPDAFRSRVSIATILLPGNRDEILKLVRYARDIGVPRIALSPLLKSSRSSPMRADGKALQGLEEFLPRLLAEEARPAVSASTFQMNSRRSPPAGGSRPGASGKPA